MKSYLVQKIKEREYEFVIFAFLFVKLFFIHSVWPLELSVIASVIFIAFFSFVGAKFLRSYDGAQRKVPIGLFALFLSGAASNMVFFPKNLQVVSLTFENIVLLTCVILSVVLIDVEKHMGKIPFLCLIAMAVNPLYIFLFFPLLAALFFLRLNSSKYSKDYRVIFPLSILGSLLGFVVYYLRTHDLAIFQFTKVSMVGLLINLLRVLPLVFIFAYLWLKAYMKTKDKWFKKSIIFALFCFLLPFVAVFFVGNNISPLMASLFLQFLYLGNFLAKETEKNEFDFFEALSFLHKNRVLLFTILVYLSAFSIFRYNYTVQTWLMS
ncbi:MAG: hypothetical protein GX345_06040 [Clostridiales bacterium]|nr:hypothetical protein [Clostridiales bacterium]